MEWESQRKFHEARLARADVDMLFAPFADWVPDGDQAILSLLPASARKPSWRMRAVGLPIEN